MISSRLIFDITRGDHLTTQELNTVVCLIPFLSLISLGYMLNEVVTLTWHLVLDPHFSLYCCAFAQSGHCSCSKSSGRMFKARIRDGETQIITLITSTGKVYI